MKKVLIALALVLVSFASKANSKWGFVVISSEKDIFFIDYNSIQKSGDSVTFWVRSNFNERTMNGNLSDKVQLTINCRRQERIGRYYIFYDDINNNGRITSSSPAIEPKWEPIAPDTINWSLYEVVCKK